VITTFNGQELVAHRRAQGAFADVLHNVKTDQLGDQTPCSDWTVRDLAHHVIAGNRRVAGTGGDLAVDLDALVAAHDESAAAAQTAFAAPDGLTRIVHVPFGDVPGVVFIGLRTTDVITHAWDLARATHQPTDLEPDLAGVMLEWSRQAVRVDLRGPGGPFGAEQPCPDNACNADRLAAFLGRPLN
jgi:uncharacterized protein (TIGR03086 family)